MSTCPNCAATAQPGKFCSYCGAEILPVAAELSSSPVPQVNVSVQTTNEPAAEKMVYQDPNIGVTITTARAVIGAQTFAVANITSVAVRTSPPDNGLATAFFFSGIVVGSCGYLATESTGWAVIGFVVVAVAAAMMHAAKATHHVRLGTAGGETQALSSHDANQIKKVAAALNDAIIQRG